MNYGELIKKIREKMMLTQTEFAELLGVSFSSVNRWEKGHYEPTLKTKRKIMKLYNEQILKEEWKWVKIFQKKKEMQFYLT